MGPALGADEDLSGREARHPEAGVVLAEADEGLRVLCGLERDAPGPHREDTPGAAGRLPGAGVRRLRRWPGDRSLLQRRLRPAPGIAEDRGARPGVMGAPIARHCPVQTGGRFSKNAATPSRASADPAAARRAE